MESFALYRMPFQKECRYVRMTGRPPRTLAAIRDIDDTPGFVIAPFSPGVSESIVLIENHESGRYPTPEALPESLLRELDSAVDANSGEADADHPDRSDYTRDFTTFHRHICDGKFSKLVLARKKTVGRTAPGSATALFKEACRRYPRCFITLFSTAESGTWLVATPELLIEKLGRQCHTMALAGTMEYQGQASPEWSAKNIMEQHCVTAYIRDAIRPFATDITADGPHTVRAAGLVHLRTDFSFRLPDGHLTGSLLDALHPTPAVCGLPAAAAHDFIVANEHSPRAYYSGFCGPVAADEVTALYVTLRCMRLRPDSCSLFAGGGLLADSTEDSEWAETEAKMKTMYNLLENELL